MSRLDQGTQDDPWRLDPLVVAHANIVASQIGTIAETTYSGGDTFVIDQYHQDSGTDEAPFVRHMAEFITGLKVSLRIDETGGRFATLNYDSDERTTFEVMLGSGGTAAHMYPISAYYASRMGEANFIDNQATMLAVLRWVAAWLEPLMPV